jgi:hypothetical protein
VLASVGLVAALGIGAAGGLATGAAARTSHGKSHGSAVVATPVTTATFSFSVSISGLVKNGGAITLTGTGQADLVNDAVSLTVNLPAAVAALIPGGTAAPEVVNVVFSGGTVYANVPSLATLVGEPWISVALPSSATAAVPGIFNDVASALGNVNEILSFAKTHHAKVTSLGSSTVDETSVTGSQVSAHIKGVRVSATLWADASNRVVRATLGAAKGGARRGFAISATADFSGYGNPVTITVPPSSQVRAIPLSLITSVLGRFLHGAHLGAKLAKVA